MVKLEDFVRDTLVQILRGVRQSQEVAREMGAYAEVNYTRDRSNPRDSKVEFDVALSVEQGEGSQAGAGVFIGPVVLGARGKSDETSTTVSRIKFPVHVHLPLQDR